MHIEYKISDKFFNAIDSAMLQLPAKKIDLSSLKYSFNDISKAFVYLLIIST